MDFSRQGLENGGFTGFARVEDLQRPGGCNVIPKQMGVYVVVRENSTVPTFLVRSIGGHFKSEDPILPVEELTRNWVGEAYVVYIGKAGGMASAATLRSRLKQYMDFGCGRPVGHRGGRMIWQLADSDDLRVAWKPIVNREPVVVEQEMIDEFVRAYGMFPFANRRR